MQSSSHCTMGDSVFSVSGGMDTEDMSGHMFIVESDGAKIGYVFRIEELSEDQMVIVLESEGEYAGRHIIMTSG